MAAAVLWWKSSIFTSTTAVAGAPGSECPSTWSSSTLGSCPGVWDFARAGLVPGIIPTTRSISWASSPCCIYLVGYFLVCTRTCFPTCCGGCSMYQLTKTRKNKKRKTKKQRKEGKKSHWNPMNECNLFFHVSLLIFIHFTKLLQPVFFDILVSLSVWDLCTTEYFEILYYSKIIESTF